MIIDQETTLITLPHYPKMSKMTMQTMVFAASVICAVNSLYLEKRGIDKIQRFMLYTKFSVLHEK